MLIPVRGMQECNLTCAMWVKSRWKYFKRADFQMSIRRIFGKTVRYLSQKPQL